MSGLAEDRLKALPGGSFDLVYLDPPYGTTSGEWDKVPDWRDLGVEVQRILKADGQVILHGMAAMAARCLVAFESVGLRHRFELVWLKQSMPWSSNFHPLHAHELIHVFARKDAPTDAMMFNRRALGWLAEPYHRRQHAPPSHYSAMTTLGSVESESDGWRLPVDVIYCPSVREGTALGHYAQKPEELVRWLILGLSSPGDRVMDPYAGTGTTLVVASRLGRKAMGIEASPSTWRILSKRIKPYLRFEGWDLGETGS